MVSGRYFNRRVMALYMPQTSALVRETKDKIMVFGEGDDRYSVE
jgi:hypothetical protein